MRDAQRTFFWYNTTIEPTRPKKVQKTFRNPVIQAKEMHLEMEYHNLTKAQLARKLNISRARVTQMLNLLKLPDELIQEVEEMGDHWQRRLMTERTLREIAVEPGKDVSRPYKSLEKNFNDI
jgi:hypothetical protein